MKYLLLLFLISCASEPKCVDKVRIIKCGPDHKDVIICYETEKCNV